MNAKKLRAVRSAVNTEMLESTRTFDAFAARIAKEHKVQTADAKQLVGHFLFAQALMMIAAGAEMTEDEAVQFVKRIDRKMLKELQA